jgi:hypothetical protein
MLLSNLTSYHSLFKLDSHRHIMAYKRIKMTGGYRHFVNCPNSLFKWPAVTVLSTKEFQGMIGKNLYYGHFVSALNA